MTTLLQVQDLVVEYPGRSRRTPYRALSGISIDIRSGETLGLVGESGSGKTTLGRAILGLAPVTAGTISFDGQRIDHLGRRNRRPLAQSIQVVFQDPYTSLNPSLEVGDILAEPLIAQGSAVPMPVNECAGFSTRSVSRVIHCADALASSRADSVSVSRSRALAIEPKLIVCDEPVSALDLQTQRRVIDLFIDIQERTGVSYLFVSHDLSVVRAVSHRVVVLYRGSLVESGDVHQVVENPRDDYTKRLLAAAPVPDPAVQRERRAQRRAFT